LFFLFFFCDESLSPCKLVFSFSRSLALFLDGFAVFGDDLFSPWAKLISKAV